MTPPGSPEPAASRSPLSDVGYYDLPVIHRPHWKWLVIGYFYFGGISGASAVIAAFARLYGGAAATPLARIATYVSFLSLVPCPLLLILDLGRPARFFNMLRVYRASSPMSVGSWGLAAFGGISALTAALQLVEDRSPSRDPRLGGVQRAVTTVVAVLSALSGFVVAGYTGVLLAATAVPLWSKRPALLGPLFLASAMTSGAAAITAVSSAFAPEDSHAYDRLRTLETASTIAEESLLVVWIMALGPTSRPISEGRLGALVRHGAVGAGMALPLTISAISNYLPKGMHRPAVLVSAALTLAGVFVVRYAVVVGGRQSADDPQATFDMTG